MISWILYIISSIIVSWTLSVVISKKIKPIFFIFILIFLLTPATVEVGSSRLAPALFIFFYDSLFQQIVSMRSLRPVVFTLPIGFLFVFLLSLFKKRFSGNSSH